MALDATVSGLSSNTYLLDAEFTAYAAGSLAAARVTASIADTRERALRTATRMLDRLEFHGLATVPAQALQWPRYIVQNPDRWGYYFDQNEIPRRLKEATAELALALLGEGQSSPDGTLSDAAKYTKARVDVLEVEFREGIAAATTATGILKRYPAVWSLIEPLLDSTGQPSVVRA